MEIRMSKHPRRAPVNQHNVVRCALFCSFRGLSISRKSVPVAARSNLWVCGRSIPLTADLNPSCGAWCLSVVSVVCCQVEGSARGWSLVQSSPTDCSASLCDLETSWMRGPWPTGRLGSVASKFCGQFWHGTSLLSAIIVYWSQMCTDSIFIDILNAYFHNGGAAITQSV